MAVIREHAYTVLLQLPAGNRSYLVTCPALPSVRARGHEADAALKAAADALRVEIERLLRAKKPIPKDRKIGSSADGIAKKVTIELKLT